MHRRALVVATHARAVEHADRIEDAVGRNVGVDHADLVAVVEERRAPQAEQHDQRGARPRGIVLAQRVGKRWLSWLPPVHTGHAFAGQQRLRVLDRLAQLRGLEVGVQQHEVEREVQLVAVAVERANASGSSTYVSPMNARGGS